MRIIIHLNGLGRWSNTKCGPFRRTNELAGLHVFEGRAFEIHELESALNRALQWVETDRSFGYSVRVKTLTDGGAITAGVSLAEKLKASKPAPKPSPERAPDPASGASDQPPKRRKRKSQNT